MNDVEKKIWHAGEAHGAACIIDSVLRQSDKISFITVLYGKAHEEANKETDEHKKHDLLIYAEALRHVLNILKTLGTAREAYATIIKPDLLLTITDEDIKWHR